MMGEKDRAALTAFAMLLLAICYLATVGAVLAYHGRYAEALGFGGAVTGLIGVLGTFRPRSSQATTVQHVDTANVINEGKQQ